ncbi:Transcription factor Sp1 [Melipona quadrifasciata]|uniref:Transcription factor Sp1 n=1 Tax=Melipona quadrifasciata TaxID=166423 RepID=A0A0N0U7E7_9HYME|nr:Transcription factor Sp1 [Melipona quadrifasciata]
MKKQRPKKFRCEHCDVAFSNNGQLKGHVRIHTGERPFKCDFEGCGKTFTRNEELTRHKRIHTGIRPHACFVCGKRFGRKDHLKKHMRTHENRDPYRLSATTLGIFVWKRRNVLTLISSRCYYSTTFETLLKSIRHSTPHGPDYREKGTGSTPSAKTIDPFQRFASGATLADVSNAHRLVVFSSVDLRLVEAELREVDLGRRLSLILCD